MIEISKFLGTILGTMGTIEVCKRFMKIRIFFIFYVYVGYPDGTQVVPKLPDTFYCMINFHHFEGPKNGAEATLTIILGTIANSWVPSMIFSENISCQLLEKKGTRYLDLFTYLA